MKVVNLDFNLDIDNIKRFKIESIKNSAIYLMKAEKELQVYII